MSTDEPPTSRGKMGLTISNALVSLMHDATGRGPNKARTTIDDDSVVVIMRDTLTRAERTLADAGRTAEVLDGRSAMQDIIADDAIKAVQDATGRKVIGFMSENHIDPDLAAEVFVLEPLAGPKRRAGKPERDEAP